VKIIMILISLVLLVTPTHAEVNLTGLGGGPMDIKPGEEYLVLKGGSTALEYKWAVWGNGPFEFKVKGVRALKVWGITTPLPNPFNTDWSAAVPSFGGQKGIYGVNATDTMLSLFILVRSSQLFAFE